MSPDTHTLTFERSLRAPLRQVFNAFTNGTALREWFCDYATTEPRPNGRIYLAWNSGFYTAGQFIRTEPPQDGAAFMSYTWYGKGEPAATEIAVSLSAAGETGTGETGTSLRLEHCGVGSGPAWEATRGEIVKGWNESLDNLASTLETGEDLRFVNRPMLGITFSDFNAEIAAHLGVPIQQAIRIDEPVSGMGAARAGLQSGDVIFEMDGRPAIDFASLTAVLQSHKAGDVIDVAFYRGPQKMTLPMQLSRRPLPDIPTSLSGLADALRPRYAKMAAELDALFAGVSDEQARRIPTPGEWSAMDVLAHLIHGEHGWQNAIQEMVGGQEPQYDDYGGNLSARNHATVAAYGTLAAMLNELKRAGDETVAFVAGLPAEFVERKTTFWRLALNALENPYHFQTHMEQMRLALQ